MDISWLGVIGGWLIKFLPKFIVRWFYGPEKVANDFEIDLTSDLPVQIYNVNTQPVLNLKIRYTNISPLPILIDRLLVNLTLNSCQIDGAMLERVKIPPKKTNDPVVVRILLSDIQRTGIKDFRDAAQKLGVGQRVNIALHVYGECAVGPFEKKVSKERDGAVAKIS